MTRAHRTLHAWIWLLAAVVLVLVIRTGVAVRPGPTPLNDVPDAVAAVLDAPQGAEAPAFEPVVPPAPEPVPPPPPTLEGER